MPRRMRLAGVGLFAYIAVTRRIDTQLDDMLGTQGTALAMRKRAAMTVYGVGGLVAVVVSLFNPLGIAITLVAVVALSSGAPRGCSTWRSARPVNSLRPHSA